MNAIRLEGALLAQWVAKAAGLVLEATPPAPGVPHDPAGERWHPLNFHPDADWTHAARFLMADWYGLEDFLASWLGPQWSYVPVFRAEPLVWFMRAYVATQFGEVLENIDSQ